MTISDVLLDREDHAEIPAIQFSISNYGAAIPDGELELVFEEFTQSTVTKANAGGTGLGLSLCREIIKSHSGEIWAESHPNGGGIFTFQFPKRQ